MVVGSIRSDRFVYTCSEVLLCAILAITLALKIMHSNREMGDAHFIRETGTRQLINLVG